MNILFDHCTPRPLRGYLDPHTVDTADDRGWAELDNGELISRAEEHGYDLFVTTDADMLDQQVLVDRRLGVVVILSNRWPLIRQVARAGAVRTAVESTAPGSVAVVPVPSTRRS